MSDIIERLRSYSDGRSYNYHPPIADEAAEIIVALRARATELLEALEELVTLTDRKHNAWDRARVVICKAKGDQP